MNKILIQNPRIINEGRSFIGSVLVEGDKIAAVFEGEVPGNVRAEANQVIDATGKWLIPGVIDDQVHFRDPGLTHKGDIGTESRAAVAGGVTTFMDMPNTKPQTTTIADLEWKFNVPPRSPVRITPSSSVGQTIIWTRSAGWIVAVCRG